MRREASEQIRDGRSMSLIGLSLLALLAGVLTGGASVLFRAAVAGVHNIFFLGDLSFYYDPNLHTPASWLGPLVILSPALGGIVVVLLVRALPADRRGQGVSDVIDAIYYREGRVRTVSAFVKSIAAGIQSGSGGSVGREAAIVQIGAALASRLSRLLRIAQWQRMTLVAAGGAAGLAAAFNAPLGSIVFAIELMMPEISARTLLPVTIATGASTFVTRFFYGLQPTFLVETVIAAHLRIAGVVALVPFVGFGILLGFVSWSMIWLLGWSERQFARISPNPYLQHIIGMLLVGLLAYVLLVTTGHYYVAGPSYAALQDILRGDISTLGLLRAAVRGEADRHRADLGIGWQRRRVLGVAGDRRVARRRGGGGSDGAGAEPRPRCHRFRGRRHGGHARRHDGGSDHGDRHGLRADARLQRDRADDPRRHPGARGAPRRAAARASTP